MNINCINSNQISYNSNYKQEFKSNHLNSISFGCNVKTASGMKNSFFKNLFKRCSLFIQRQRYKVKNESAKAIILSPHSLTLTKGDMTLWGINIKGLYRTSSGNIEGRASVAGKGRVISGNDIRLHDSSSVSGTISALGRVQIVNIKKGINDANISGESIVLTTEPKAKSNNIRAIAEDEIRILCPVSNSYLNAKNIILNNPESPMKDIIIKADSVFINTHLSGNSIITAQDIRYGNKAQIDSSVKIITETQ